MKTATVIVKTDKATKAKAQRFAAQVGLTLSDVVNLELCRILRTGTIIISTNPHLTPSLRKTLARTEQEIEQKMQRQNAPD